MNVLLMTATIIPKRGVPNLVRTDPDVRRRDYEEAFRFYASLLGTSLDFIIFAENSGADLGSLERLAQEIGVGGRVEFLSFDGLAYPPEYDRGYGEFLLVDYAMQNSRILQENDTGSDLLIWKVTGRYRIDNLARMISRRPETFELYCNFRNHSRRVVDMYLMAWTRRGYDLFLKGVYQKLNVTLPNVAPGTHPEELLRNILDGNLKLGKVVRRFAVTPRVSGVRGGDNKGYGTDNLWKYRLRNASRQLLPWLWI